MSFAKRRINLDFQLGTNPAGQQVVFEGTNSDTVSLTGLKVTATISKSGGLANPYLQLSVYGMTLSQMNQLSILGKPIIGVRANNITVTAGDDVSGMSVVFSGTITESWAAMSGAPNTCLTVSAVGGLIDLARPIPPSSYRGPADVATIMAGLADQMKIGFVNNGVSVMLSNPYYPGTAVDQMRAAAADANIHAVIDDASPAVGPSGASPQGVGQVGKVLAIWPMGGSREGLSPLISAATGMVGYPTCTQSGIVVRMLYNPSVVIGGVINVESDLTVATAPWYVFSLTQDLESETPGGAWYTTVEGSQLGHTPPIAPTAA